MGEKGRTGAGIYSTHFILDFPIGLNFYAEIEAISKVDTIIIHTNTEILLYS